MAFSLIGMRNSPYVVPQTHHVHHTYVSNYMLCMQAAQACTMMQSRILLFVTYA